jgi:hypothetical protein
VTSGGLPKALVPNQALIPLLLHRSLYPSSQPSYENSPTQQRKFNAASPQPLLKDVLFKTSTQVTKPVNQQKRGLLTQSLGALQVGEDAEEIVPMEQEAEDRSPTSPLTILFSLLYQTATSPTAGQESILLMINILKKIAKNFTFQDVRQEI